MTLSCPHCGLKLAMSGPRHEYCPRCLAKRHQPVPLIASSLFRRASADARGEEADTAPSRGVERAQVAALDLDPV